MNNVEKFMLQALIVVRAEVTETPHATCHSICGYLQHLYSWWGPHPFVYGEVHNLLTATWQSWPGFSGDIVFPVPSADAALSACDAYLHTSGKPGERWRGEYGEHRISLLNYLIDKLEAVK